jgi:hypothetical protein
MPDDSNLLRLRNKYIAHCNQLGISTTTAQELFAYHKDALVQAYQRGYRVGKNGMGVSNG